MSSTKRYGYTKSNQSSGAILDFSYFTNVTQIHSQNKIQKRLEDLDFAACLDKHTTAFADGKVWTCKINREHTAVF